MNIVFRTTKMEKIFCSEKMLVRKFGKVNARKIQRRMKFLRAAPNLAQVPKASPTRRHQLKGKFAGCFAVDLEHPFRLIFRSACENVPTLENGEIDLSKITDIEILSVEDYH